MTLFFLNGQRGKVLIFISGSRDLDAPTIFQIANIDFGEICCTHSEEVTDIVNEYGQ